jgi:hypothetical protein
MSPSDAPPVLCWKRWLLQRGQCADAGRICERASGGATIGADHSILKRAEGLDAGGIEPVRIGYDLVARAYAVVHNLRIDSAC